ncbi:hypothetical protein [Aquabacter cavernae]|uniref:hypothetical protein n=1 Tax=Aquabacter cavernae TaxID=2496029 RepID=UPI000F8F613D|nr:hypothetical protein [Aquabacter cavernae]
MCRALLSAREANIKGAAAKAAAAIAFFGLFLAASPSLALMAPEYYERARANAPDVVVLKVTTVTGPEAAYGNCKVEGTVTGVERGRRYSVGAPLAVEVPCRKPGAKPPLGAVLYNAFVDLQTYPFGRAYLLADGKLSLYQYHPLQRFP